MKVLITGCARSGTSLLTCLMRGFRGLHVVYDREVNPRYVWRKAGWPEPFAIKFPQGRFNPRKDFGVARLRHLLKALWRSPYLRDYADSWKVLVCVRDARDVLTSCHSSSPGAYWVSPERWIFSVRRIRALQEHPNLHLVKYELLVTEPRQQMNAVADFLGLPFDGDWVGQFHRHVREGTEIANGLNGIRPIDDGSVGRWRQAQHRRRMEEIYGAYGEELDRLLADLGYEFSPSRPAGISVSSA